MLTKKRTGIFISYARSDGEEYANTLRTFLVEKGFDIWQDLTSLQGGRNWWAQITDALNHVEYLLLVMTPNALKSETVTKEWRYARQQGVSVYPIKYPGFKFEEAPTWMRKVHFYDLAIKLQKEKLLKDLTTRRSRNCVPFMAGDLQPSFVPRLKEHEAIVQNLLSREQHNITMAITTALRGAGGYGKTTLAKAICHDERILEKYNDGILWVTLGEKVTKEKLTNLIKDLIESLTGDRPGFADLITASSKFMEVLAQRDILLIIDDVWNRSHLEPFLQFGKHCACLITTRNNGVVPSYSYRVDVDAMQTSEAVALLSTGLLESGFNSNNAFILMEFHALATRLGEWPLLLNLVNSALRSRVIQLNQPLPSALTYVNKLLNERGLSAFDARNVESRDQAVEQTLAISLELLSTAERLRYAELAIFPEDTDIPIDTVSKLWSITGRMNETETEELCAQLASLSLLLRCDLCARTINLHDVMRTYLIHQHKRDSICELNEKFLSAYSTKKWADLAIVEQYLWKYLAYHLLGARRKNELRSLLLDFEWLRQKLIATDVNTLLSDYNQYTNDNIVCNDKVVLLIQEAIRLSAHILASNIAEISELMVGRLCAIEEPEIIHFLKQIKDSNNDSWLCPLFPTLNQAGGAEKWTLSGHTDIVMDVAVTLDRKIAISASKDRTLKVWDLTLGKCTHTLSEHIDCVLGVAITPDGQHAISCSGDRTLKIWDISTGTCLKTLAGHMYDVAGLSVTPDGKKAILAPHSFPLTVWDLENKTSIQIPISHWSSVMDVAVAPDGQRLILAYNDNLLKVWDLKTTKCLQTLIGHTAWVKGVAISPDGQRAISASYDRTLKVWDLATGKCLKTLVGHADRVNCVSISPNGQLAISGSGDRTIKVWDLLTGKCLQTMVGHSRQVLGLVVTFDGKQVISASADRTLKVWEIATDMCQQSNNNHTANINDVIVTPNGQRVISASADQTLKVWDLATGMCLQTLVGHTAPVVGRQVGLVVTTDGKRVISVSWDGVLQVWEIATGVCLQTLNMGNDTVHSVDLIPGGQKVVTATSGILQVWDLTTEKCLKYCKDGCRDIIKFDDINRVVVTAAGQRAISASYDQTLKVWDLATGKCLQTLAGHSDSVTRVVVTPDEQLVISASSDQTLKVWNWATGKVFAIHHFEEALSACAVAPDSATIVIGGESGRLYFMRFMGKGSFKHAKVCDEVIN